MNTIPGFTRIQLAALAALLLSAVAQAQPHARQVARQIDRLLTEEFLATDVTLAPRANDETFLRRIWLDLVGDIPAPEDVTAFLIDPNPDKRADVVRQLLAQQRFGQNWARYWRDVIVYRRIEDRSMLVSNSLVVDLSQWLNEGRPWNEIAREFIAARGDIREHGATAIIAAQEGRTEETTAEVSRIFLGIQIQCAQCHDHPFDRWQREQFHELAAFFPRVGLRQVQTPTRRTFEVIANDRPQRRLPDQNNRRRGVPEHYMPDLDDPAAAGTQMQPRFFLTNAELPVGTDDSQRRANLADWITTSDWFAIAFVNRIWAELVGEGFYEPIDDLGPDRTPSAPAAVERLAEAFAQRGYDVKWLFRTICGTEAYGRESRPRRSPAEVPFTANVAQRLRGDQLFDALLTALDVDEPAVARGGLVGRGAGKYGQRPSPRMMFTTFFGYDPSDPRDTVSSSIPQALAMMNTPRINALINGQARRTMLGRLLRNMEQDEQVIMELYLRCLSREPSSGELDHALQYVASCDDRRQAYEDLLWALLNSAEFVHRR